MRKLIQFFLDPWIIFGALGFGLALLIATVLLLNWTRSPQTANDPENAEITVIDLPTATPTVPTATPTEVVTPEATGLPLPPPGDMSIDAFVEVAGTGGDGLRLRVGPGLDRDVRLIGLEAEVFLVQDGPEQVDGFAWWYLEGPFDESRRGWAVANYLRVVQNP
jgi:hypothetical protein